MVGWNGLINSSRMGGSELSSTMGKLDRELFDTNILSQIREKITIS